VRDGLRHRRVLERPLIVFDGFRPDRYDLVGATICLVGVAVIMYAPR
jgi:drug/metabolite transporter superfamily protein YnfA